MYNELAATTIDGVYVCENAAARNAGESGIIFKDWDFFEALATLKDGETIYGWVSEAVAEKIQSDYGIHSEYSYEAR